MKKNILYGSLIGLSSLGMLASCASDYLDETPITEIGTDTAMGSTKAAKMAVLGMARAMYTQYYDISAPRGCSGEGTFNAAYSDALGPDDVSYFHMREVGINWFPWKSMHFQSSTHCNSAWMYCYNFVGQANTILDNIANAEGEESERQFIEAQARTFRAHGYIKALQYFGPRWQDSNNGAKHAIVLRKEGGTAPAPLGTMQEVIDFIYEDLETAERLYQESGMKRNASYEPDIYVAYGLHARAALLCQDWATAKDKAHKAREGREVMSMEEYYNGFLVENAEYMWTNFDNDIYYSSPGSWFSCNGSYPSNWQRGYNINIDLYNKLDPNDGRRKLYFMPDRVADVAAMPGYEEVASLKPEDFWNESTMVVSEVNYVTGYPDIYYLEPGDKGYEMSMLISGFVQLAADNNTLSDMSDMVRWPYALSPDPFPTSMNLGASVKMWSHGNYNDSAYPYMRAAEMYLTEAEAAYMAGDMATAKECLTAVNSKRIPDYACTTSGDDLLDEIRTCRRIELWGEGFNFPDFKRWNLPFEKRAFKAGDPTSGNTASTYAFKVETSTNNGWRLAIPQQELDANPGIDRGLLK